MTTNRGLYVHIPFCLRKCGYCDFYSVASDTELMSKYIDEVCRELTAVIGLYPDTVIDTVYFGGGTPSIVSQSIIARLIEHIHRCASVDIKEFSVEGNPCSSDKLFFYKSSGVNRISLGVQTLEPNILSAIGRAHTPLQALDALERARSIFDNVSADVMLGLPGQTVHGVADTLSGIMPFVTHISQYMLKLSDEVPMAKAVAKGSIALPDDDLTADMYDTGYSLMQKQAFERYEISNFAKSGYSCMHNLKYWNREDYIGVGAAAHSFINGVRYDNPADLGAYLSGCHLGNGRANVTPITQSDALFEYIMLKLRLEEGFEVKDINNKFEIDFLSDYNKEIASLSGILDATRGRIRMKPDKMLLESYAARKFLR